jgi:hypothetical protein
MSEKTLKRYMISQSPISQFMVMAENYDEAENLMLCEILNHVNIECLDGEDNEDA